MLGKIIGQLHCVHIYNTILNYRKYNFVVEMQSSVNNATVHGNPEKDSKSHETAMFDDSHSYTTINSLQLEHNNDTHETVTHDDRVRKDETSNPMATARQIANENPYVIDTSSENTSTTT